MAEPRAEITLRCTVCKNENYITTKNKKLHSEKFQVKKYCPHCNKSTVHQEKKETCFFASFFAFRKGVNYGRNQNC